MKKHINCRILLALLAVGILSIGLTGVGYAAEAYIGDAKAREIAYAHVGAAADAVPVYDVEIETYRGTTVYDVEFQYGDREYTYKINTASGAILDNKSEYESNRYSHIKPSDYISSENAKSRATGHAGLSTSDVLFTHVSFEMEGNMMVFEIEFTYVGSKNECLVNAYNGNIIKYEGKTYNSSNAGNNANNNTSTAQAKGWQHIGGQWYYYVNNSPAKGWQHIGDDWYFMDWGTGTMQTGWLKDGSSWYYLEADGEMETGWERIGGKWYYFKQSGAMATGWQQLGGKWYYLYIDGSMAVGTIRVGSRTYTFSSNGSWIG